MADRPQNEYLKAQIMTASPEQLQMMLYNGAIRFAEQARQAIVEGDIAAMHDRLIRAQRIVMELAGGLKTDVDPGLCGKLASLYNYVYRLLVDANFHRTVEPLDEALELLHYQRDTWQLLIEKLREERSGAVPAPRPSADRSANAPAGGTLCLDG